ncbi:MAG TPA: response regulator [Phycisphaerales bacterium]|nr:response regulator [Phycisphaerales bacterium]
MPKTVLLVDDEQGYLEALADALEFQGYRVLKATNGSAALEILSRESVDLISVDIMMPPGPALEGVTGSHSTGVYLCGEIRKVMPFVDLFCISVVSEQSVIRKLEAINVRFLRKGETPLKTVLDMFNSRLTGVAYSPDRRGRKK